jgi:two-component system OmpR family sensor kinase
MFLRSIRYKIILWYMLILFLTLLLFSGFLYRYLSQRLRVDIDDLLETRAEGIIDSVDTYWEMENLGIAKDNVANDFSKIDGLNFKRIAKRWVLEKTTDPALLNIVVQIYDVNGELIANSKNIPEFTTLPGQTLSAVLQARSVFDRISVEITPGKSRPMRTLTVPVVENEKISYIVQVASLLTSLDAVLKSLMFILFLLLPITVALSGLIGAFLARLVLSPVNRMVDTAQRITAENLKLRIIAPQTNDEIQRLADTFNEMLTRLELGYVSQKQFIEDLAHELKTPLSVLKGEFEVTLKRIRAAKEYESTLESSLEEVNKIVRLVENLLLLARLDKSVVNLEKKPVDVGLLVQRAVSSIKILAEQKNIEVQISAQKDTFVDGDEDNLKRLFLNLLDNAVKYTAGGGTVAIRLSREPGWLKVAVEDTGIGIAEEDLPHIFDRFYRSDKDRAHQGFGLGLSIAKSIVEAHQGRIEVQSSFTRGSVFTAFLPISPRP